MTIRPIYLLLAGLSFFIQPAQSQKMKMSEVVIVNYPELRSGVSQQDFKDYISAEFIPAAKKGKTGGAQFYLFEADRGKDKGKLILVYTPRANPGGKKPVQKKSPFSNDVAISKNGKASGFITNPDEFIEYHLVGADRVKSLPEVALLGIHYIQVKKERIKDFEAFVSTRMHPAVANLFPDMGLLTYKAVSGNESGNESGNYITIFAIASAASRDRFWPWGKPETEVLKNGFKPLAAISAELEQYLVPGSYLEPVGGAAAIFESKDWTDYILQAP